MEGPLWLTRPEDVLSHLLYVAAEIPSAVLTVEGMQVHGQLAPPDEGSGQVCFIVDSNLDGLVNSPPPGRSVRLDYEGDEDAYSFFSEVVGTDMLKRWILDAPRTVERTQQRLIARHEVSGNPEFGLQVQLDDGLVEVQIQDLSNNGISFALHKSQGQVKEGTVVSGVLEVPGLHPLRIQMEVRNIRNLPGSSKIRLAGTRFHALANAERGALARALATWYHQEHQG